MRTFDTLVAPSPPGRSDIVGAVDIERAILEHNGLELLEIELGRLPASTRTVFLMYHARKLSRTEIASALRISTSAVDRELVRALKRLRHKLGPIFAVVCER